MGDGLLQSVEGQFKHGEDLLDTEDGLGVRPFPDRYGIDPYRMREGFGDELQPIITGLS